MPEEATTAKDLERVIDELGDYSLNTKHYETLQNTLDSVDYVTAPLAEKLLSLCSLDQIEDTKYTVHIINIIFSLLKKIKNGHYVTFPNLVTSALAVLNVLKTTALFSKFEALKALCFKIIPFYPDETLITVTEYHANAIFELISVYCHQIIPPETRIQPIAIVGKLLKILPPDKKTVFAKDGIRIWFSKVIPIGVDYAKTNSKTVPNVIEVLEILTEELLQFDYSNNHDWLNLLESIHTSKRYPAIMKSLLEKDSEHWHRLWIMFIKLLKNQITKCSNTTASPINSLLPCVEFAFKMDTKNRCKAFQCWNVLIDNFSNETNEVYLKKSLKLLVVPLTSNNAKGEETALAKFKTWWLLIIRFQTKMDKFMEMVVIPFLYFCFGKPTASALIPGNISKTTKVECAQAFINIVGHSQCEGCVTLPKLHVKLLNTKILVDHWKDWIHSLSNAIKICVQYNDEFAEKQVKCVWRTFVMTIAELPENNIRRDLFIEALVMLEGLTQNCDNHLMNAIVNTLIPTLFNRYNNVQELLKSKDEQHSPISKILAILNKLPLDTLENRKNTITSITLLTNFMVEDAIKSSINTIEPFLRTLSPNGMLLWTAMAESICTYVFSVYPNMLTKMFTWPFEFMDNFVSKEESTTAWLNMYKIISPYITMKQINKDVIQALSTNGDNQSSCEFVLSAAIVVLKWKLNQEDNDLNNELELILQLTSQIDEVQIKLLLPSLADVIVHTLTSLKNRPNSTIAERIMFIINNILKICNSLFKQQPANNETDILKNLNIIFNSLESIFKLDIYSNLKSLLADQLKECAPYLKHEKSFNNHILGIYNPSLNKNLGEQVAGEVIEAFGIINTENPNMNKNAEEITTPNRKAAKKSKRRASIINTVVENGEEFVVVKSNWKFNPRKLTDNQKEKLERKREDIPALYQDLSQSQDEFKLSNWKTDSQDTCTTSSKSTIVPTNEDVSVILKNMPNSEFVPKIIENVITKPSLDLNTVHDKEKLNSNSDKADKEKINTVKGTKSPRMALKDRVFRNVRNLIEKSHDLSHECTDVSSRNAENVLNTPLITKTKLSKNQTNSEPSQINSERPSRVKRKPKKFDDLEIFSLKRRRSINMDIAEIESIRSEITADSLKDIDVEKDKLSSADNLNVNSLAIKDDSSDNVGGLTIYFNHTENFKNTQNDALTKDKDKLCSDDTTITLNKINKKKDVLAIPQNIENNPASTHNVSKIGDKVQEKVCTEDTLNKALEVDEIKDKIENRMCLDTKNKVEATSKSKSLKEEQNYKEKSSAYSDGAKRNATPISKDITMKETEEKPTSDIKSNTVCTPIDDKLKEKTKENMPDDTKTNVVVTPKNNNEINIQKTSSKKSTQKKSRIQNQLEIDMVEGHPFLKVQSEKRLTRKMLINTPCEQRIMSINENKNKPKRKIHIKEHNNILKEKSVSIKDSQNTEDISGSQDFIESSQDSTVTTISVKASKPVGKKMPVVILEPIKHITEKGKQNLSDVPSKINLTNMDNNSDIVLPCNKTNVTDLTEDMDTEPMNENSDIVVLSGDSPIIVSSEDVTLEQDTQNEAEADTQPVEPDMFLEVNVSDKTLDPKISDTPAIVEQRSDETAEEPTVNNETNVSLNVTDEDVTKTMSESVLAEADKENGSSPNDQRKKDFLNNTSEISPIKTLSPLRDEKSPSPESSSDYVVIKLTSPVQSNGEPFENCESPEIFTEDKVSPAKRDFSPPRDVICVVNTSPSSLSLKKNRPQVRSGGRAAQMLGLCVPDRLQTPTTSEKSADVEETKKSPSLHTPVRRNLKTLYTTGENENSDESEDSESFLKFKRTLPTTDCSPSGPILKRKLIDIADEATASPASKRKRVSFHDPPVSTTICVKKYIDSISIRSPQNSVTKRLERQARAQIAIKSPRRLDNVFKLDSVLTKAVESFSETNAQNTNEDTEMSSLEDTPVVEVIKTSDLNDTDPICVELVNCEDPIANIAAELSSPAMQDLLVKTMEGKLETVGDLAKMTELEVNRLCIKAPKVLVAKKVLSEYLTKRKEVTEVNSTTEAVKSESIVSEVTSVEVQTDSVLVESIEMQTEFVPVCLNSSQTDSVVTSHGSAQTDETGSKSTADVITTCLLERPDFVESLCDNIDESSKQRIAEDLSVDTISQMLMKRLNIDNFKDVLMCVLDQEGKFKTNGQNDSQAMSILQDYLIERFECKDLVLFCSNLLKKVYDKPA